MQRASKHKCTSPKSLATTRRQSVPVAASRNSHIIMYYSYLDLSQSIVPVEIFSPSLSACVCSVLFLPL